MRRLTRLSAIAVLAVALGVLTAAGGGQPPDFGEPTVLPTGLSPYFVAAADFNHDGALDLATSNTISHTVTVFLNRGHGTFAPGVSYPTRGFTPYALAVGDLNGDHSPDIVAGNMFSVTFSVFFNKGDGTFAEARTFEAEPGPMFPVIADLDGDGIPDVAFCNIGHDTVSVYRNDGHGNLTHRGTLRTNGVVPYSLVAADFDGDGRMDLATGNIYSANVSVLRGLGDFKFADAVNYKTDSLTQILFAADLNGDGRPDLVSGNGGSDNVSVLMNAGDGTFRPAVNYPVKLPQGVAVADLNGDGFPDIATANQSANSTSVLLNKGDGTFAAATDYAVQGLYPTGVALADLNNDGRPDLITANSGSNDISILLNGLTPPRVTQTTPGAGATAIAEAGLRSPIRIETNVAINPASATALAAQVFGSQSGPHPLDIRVDRRALELRARSGADRFQPGEEITIDLARTLESTAGLSMHSGFVSTFFVQPGAASAQFIDRDRAIAPRPAWRLVPADVNGDGRLDLIAVPRDGRQLYVYTNGSTLFANPQQVDIGAHAIGDLVPADVDGDGRLDLIALDAFAPRILVAFGEGQGHFAPPMAFDLPDLPRSIAVGDFDGDGFPDVAALGHGSTLALLLSDGGRRFKTVASVPLERDGARVQAADLNGDGVLDLLVLSGSRDAVAVYRGKGDGTFLKKDTVSLGRQAPADLLLVRDLNQDGAPDLVTVNRARGTLTIRWNSGDAGFERPQTVLLGPGVRDVALGDVDGNGMPDVIALAQGSVTVLLNRGKGALGPPMVSRVEGGSTFVVGDFDGDGAPDVLTLKQDGTGLTLATNRVVDRTTSVAGKPSGGARARATHATRR